MDRLQAMQVFARVAQLGSFSKAAEQLALSPAQVTHAVQDLERHLGARLLLRTTRQVSLSEDGRQYLAHCARLLADLADAEALFSGRSGKPRGTVRVDVPERLARLLLIPALPQFFAVYPDIEIKLGATDRYVDPVGEGVDCMVRVGPLADSALIARRLGLLTQINCAAPAYVERYGLPSTPAQLGEHRAVGFFSSRSGRELPWEYVENGVVQTCKVACSVTVSSSDAYLACCLAGLGLIQIPRTGVDRYLRSGELVEVLPDWCAEPLPVAVLFGPSLSPRVRVFVEWVTALLQGYL